MCVLRRKSTEVYAFGKRYHIADSGRGEIRQWTGGREERLATEIVGCLPHQIPLQIFTYPIAIESVNKQRFRRSKLYWNTMP